MRLFNTVSLEISSRCNRRCEFCPVAYNHRPDERMANVLLLRAAKELSSLHYAGRIELYIYNEPCRDWDFLLQCLSFFRMQVPKATLMIATNGDYIRGSHMIDELYAAGLNQLLINCYSPTLYGKRLAWINALNADISRTKSVYTATGPKSRVIDMLDKSDPAAFGSGVFGLINRAGNIPDFKPPVTEPLAKMCVKPFRLLNINWTGDALVCCNDYHGEMAYGNLADSTLVELWNSPVLNTYRRNLYARTRQQPLCDVCDCHAGAYPHMVDTEWGATVPTKALYQLQKERKAAHGTSASRHRNS